MAKSSSTRGTKVVGVDKTLFTPKIDPPDHMSDLGKKIWNELIVTIPNENLLPSDAPIFEVYCETMATFIKAKRNVELMGEVIISESTNNPIMNPWATVMNNAGGKITSLAVKLRLSPSARMKADRTKGKSAEEVPTTKLGNLIKR